MIPFREIDVPRRDHRFTFLVCLSLTGLKKNQRWGDIHH
jgi:hypothetical protein